MFVSFGILIYLSRTKMCLICVTSAYIAWDNKTVSNYVTSDMKPWDTFQKFAAWLFYVLKLPKHSFTWSMVLNVKLKKKEKGKH